MITVDRKAEPAVADEHFSGNQVPIVVTRIALTSHMAATGD
jgi:hypothetical protein